jgi:hypothetical protein
MSGCLDVDLDRIRGLSFEFELCSEFPPFRASFWFFLFAMLLRNMAVPIYLTYVLSFLSRNLAWSRNSADAQAL